MNAWGYAFLYPVRKLSVLVRKICWAWLKLADLPRGWLSSHSFAAHSILGRDCLVSSSAFCVNLNPKEKIRIGSRVVCRGVLRAEPRGKIEIGDGCYIGDDTVIYCLEKVKIGNNVLIAQNCFIADNNTHPIDAQKRAAHYRSFLNPEPAFDTSAEIEHAEVVIHDDAWIGAGSLILKGVRIGEGAIIGAGSVITKDVEPWTVVAGNPSQTVKKLQNHRT